MKRLVLFYALICALFALTSGITAQSDRSQRLAMMTADLAGRTAYGRVNDAEFASAAKARYKLMSQLAESDPRAAFENALPDEILARIPARSKAYFERRESLVGELEVIAECDESTGKIRRTLKQGDDHISLHFVD
jgi:hypothetical protein